MRYRFIRTIKELKSDAWCSLETGDSPFLSFEFLSALEKTDCVGDRLGWLSFHLLIEENDKLLAFMPLYLKTNSYGELVFDWSWADAYHRVGMQYYPKLVSAIPYTPVTGKRILYAQGVDKKAIFPLIKSALESYLNENDVSSFHCLFPTEDLMHEFHESGYARRLGCQFHWVNEDYQTFDHYLSFFVSRKRKNIRKERQSVSEQGFHFQMLNGNQIEEDMWPHIYTFYEITFAKKGGYATFSPEFFKFIGKALGDKFLVNLVSYKGKYVACAIFYRDSTHLYGRHWGCFEEFHNLHFETCFYQGLDYAISHGLKIFEPGAQGEHKISRGFLPVSTWSVHKIKDSRFSAIIHEFVKKEEEYMREYIAEMMQSSPFKSLK